MGDKFKSREDKLMGLPPSLTKSGTAIGDVYELLRDWGESLFDPDSWGDTEKDQRDYWSGFAEEIVDLVAGRKK